MKTTILTFCLLCCAGQATAQTGVVGVNTRNPQGVLHIDGVGNNPASGPVDDAAASDDVIINSSGQIGVGLLRPEAKIDLSSAAPGGAIRIRDGNQSAGKVLMCGEDGVGTWSQLATGSWFAALYDGPLLGPAPSMGAPADVRTFTAYTDSVISDDSQGSVNKADGSIKLPQAGKYRVSVSIYWIADDSHSNTPNYTTQAILRVNGTELKQRFNFWGGRRNYGVQPTFINILEFAAGDELTLETDESDLRNANNARSFLFMVELLL